MIIVILAIVATLSLTAWLRLRKKGIQKRVYKTKRRFALPSGVKIWLEDEVPYPSVSAIDTTVDEMYTRAHDKGYRWDKNVTIAFLHPDSEDGVPVFQIPDGIYNGSIYDRGDYINIAGQFFPPNIIALPTQRDDKELQAVLEHEITHLILFACDKPRYESTKIHRAGEEFSL